ncbi:MAG: type I 3-dehydroquinate dehydratase [Clostridia bacterium]|nr:type I 3-dehydroquinate dehydratase [Clostridia bacterium]
MSGCGEKRTAKLGRVTLGEGMPAICVPVMGRTIPEIAQAAARAKAAQADVIELRIDSLTDRPGLQEAMDACRAVRGSAEEIPLLFTLRTRRDGGAGTADVQAYEALLGAVMESRVCDAVDCELSAGEAVFARLAEQAKAAGVLLVGSSHEFGEIGDLQRAAQWLKRQEALGADVCKAAVMTRTNAEAFALAQVYADVYEQLTIPMIAIAMGPAGIMTRVGAACMGSCLTFGTAGEASAPGQIDAKKLRTALEIVQDAIE